MPITASEMRTTARIAEVRSAVAGARDGGRRIALVPTMGALHQGHLSLVAEAHRRRAYAVMSIFVNPLQFGPSEDFARYPRDLAADSTLARTVGVDLVFAPEPDEMYGAPVPVTVVPQALGEMWEGSIRPGHFAGVLTVVAKLFNIVQPDIAIFGQKDIQQATLIAAMVRSLDFPIELVVAPTVRESDGLAMSSRNAYLKGDDRLRARSLSRALAAIDADWQKGERDPGRLERTGRAVFAAAGGVTVDYLALVDPERLAPVSSAVEGTLVITAARVGPTRLIDNMVLGRDTLHGSGESVSTRVQR